jgi:hypothetical protein
MRFYYIDKEYLDAVEHMAKLQPGSHIDDLSSPMPISHQDKEVTIAAHSMDHGRRLDGVNRELTPVDIAQRLSLLYGTAKTALTDVYIIGCESGVGIDKKSFAQKLAIELEAQGFPKDIKVHAVANPTDIHAQRIAVKVDIKGPQVGQVSAEINGHPGFLRKTPDYKAVFDLPHNTFTAQGPKATADTVQMKVIYHLMQEIRILASQFTELQSVLSALKNKPSSKELRARKQALKHPFAKSEEAIQFMQDKICALMTLQSELKNADGTCKTQDEMRRILGVQRQAWGDKKVSKTDLGIAMLEMVSKLTAYMGASSVSRLSVDTSGEPQSIIKQVATAVSDTLMSKQEKAKNKEELKKQQQEVDKEVEAALAKIPDTYFGQEDKNILSFKDTMRDLAKPLLADKAKIESARKSVLQEIQAVVENMHSPQMEHMEQVITSFQSRQHSFFSYGMQRKADELIKAVLDVPVASRGKLIDNAGVQYALARNRRISREGTLYLDDSHQIDEKRAATSFKEFKEKLQEVTQPPVNLNIRCSTRP